MSLVLNIYYLKLQTIWISQDWFQLNFSLQRAPYYVSPTVAYCKLHSSITSRSFSRLSELSWGLGLEYDEVTLILGVTEAMNAFWTSAGTRESLQLKGFKSTETKRSKSAQPLLFWRNGPRGSTDRPLQSFCREPIYKALTDHPGMTLNLTEWLKFFQILNHKEKLRSSWWCDEHRHSTIFNEDDRLSLLLPGRPLGPLNHNRSSDYRTNASLSTYPFRWRSTSRTKEKIWAPRQSTMAREAGHPAKILAGFDHP